MPSIPDDKAWLFDVDTMKPRVNNPAWVRAIQDVIDALPSEPADQLNADPNTTGFQQFLAGTGSMLAWWGDVGSNAKTNDASVIGDVVGFVILPGSDDVYNSKTGQWDKLPSGPNFAPNMAYLGWGVYVMARVDSDEKKQKAAWSAAAHLGGKDLSLWTAAYPSGFQPYRNSHFNIAGVGRRPATTRRSSPPTSNSKRDSYNHPNAAIEPRIPGIFQYYSVAEDELAKIFAGQIGRRRRAPTTIAAAWEKLTDQIGRDKPDQALQGLARHVGSARHGAPSRLAAPISPPADFVKEPQRTVVDSPHADARAARWRPAIASRIGAASPPAASGWAAG